MSTDNPRVSNSFASYNPDIDVRGTALIGTNAGKIVQHMRLDIGVGSAESQVTPTNPVPISPVVSPNINALTPSAPAVASVGTSSAQAVAANANRKGLILTNNSNNTISLAFNAAAVLNSGITLYPGATWTMGQFDFSTLQVRAIASSASSSLGIQEFT